MSKAQHIIDAILAGDRYANSRVFGDRVYTDEPILHTGASMYGRKTVKPRRRVSMPKRYREMRRLAHAEGRSSVRYAYRAERARLFVKQAKLIEDFDDDYAGSFDPQEVRANLPAYEDLSNHDLRCYVTWRTRFRGGDDAEAPLWCLLLHAFELINGIGTAPGAAGFAEFDRLRVAAQDTYMASLLEQWAQDYVVYYGLDPSLLAKTGIQADAANVAVLRAAEEAVLAGDEPQDPEELLEALVALSRYRADRSRFFRERRADVALVAARVFGDMATHCSKRRNTRFVDGMFGVPTRQTYTMFRSALFWTEEPHEDCEYKASPSEVYLCERGFWWRELPCRRFGRNKEIGALLHAIDARMRRAVGDKHELKDKPLPKYQARFVDARIGEVLALRKAQEEARIVIDRAALGSIRSAAARTREALLTDDERSDDETGVSEVPKPAVTSPDPPVQASTVASDEANGVALDPEQLALLRLLLDGASPTQDSMFVSLAVDAINEAFLDVIGDTVVDFDGERPVLIEDYAQDVRDIVGES